MKISKITHCIPWSTAAFCKPLSTQHFHWADGTPLKAKLSVDGSIWNVICSERKPSPAWSHSMAPWQMATGNFNLMTQLCTQQIRRVRGYQIMWKTLSTWLSSGITTKVAFPKAVNSIAKAVNRASSKLTIKIHINYMSLSRICGGS